MYPERDLCGEFGKLKCKHGVIPFNHMFAPVLPLPPGCECNSPGCEIGPELFELKQKEGSGAHHTILGLLLAKKALYVRQAKGPYS